MARFLRMRESVLSAVKQLFSLPANVNTVKSEKYQFIIKNRIR
jgi:hypothetical protein